MAAALTAAGLAFIGALTLLPSPEGAASWPRFCVVCGATGAQNLLLNVLLFVPFGIGLELLGVRRRRALLFVAALAVTIELLQYLVVVGRLSSVADAASNTLGGWLGIWGARTAWWWLAPTRSRARWLLAAWGGIWLATLGATAALVRLAPAPRQIVAQPEYAPSGREPFRGRVLAFTIAGARAAVGPATWRERRLAPSLDDGSGAGHAPLPAVPDPLPTGAPGAPWRAGRASLAAVVVTAGAQPRDASVVTLLDAREQLVGELSRDGQDLIARFRLRASEVRLGTPALRLAGAFRLAATGEPLRVAGGVMDGRIWAMAEGSAGARRASHPLTAVLGWSLLLPFGYALNGTSGWLSALWVAGLVAPLGYWGAFATLGRDGARHGIRPAGSWLAWPGVLAVLLAAGLGGVAAVTRTPVPAWPAWLGGTVGLAAGWALARAVARCEGGAGARTVRGAPERAR